MKHSTTRILTTHVGSLARPPQLLDEMRKKQQNERYSAADLDKHVRDAVIDSVQRQADAGIDIVTDGEMGKVGFFLYVTERLSGLSPSPGETRLPPFWQAEIDAFPEYYDYYLSSYFGGNVTPLQKMICDGQVTYQGHDAVQTDIENLRAAMSATEATEGFLCSTSPRQLGRNDYYASEEEYLYAVADALHEEYRAIVDAGFVLQVDDPTLIELLSGGGGATPEECDRAAARHVEVINHALRGLPEERIRLHTCYGLNHGPRIHDLPFATILPHMLRINAGAYSYEAGNPRHMHEWRIWENTKLPDGKIIIPGLVGHATNYVEHPELIAEYIKVHANLVGRENIIAGVDCGFSSQATYTPEVHPRIVWAKFGALAEGAELASRALWAA